MEQHSSLQQGIEAQANNSAVTDGAGGDHARHEKNVRNSNWTDAFLDDSGHFTVSPDVENLASGGSGSGYSGSSRGPSPTLHSTAENSQPISTALVLQACREDKYAQSSRKDVPISVSTKYAYGHNASYSESTSKHKDDTDDSPMSSPSASHLKTALENFNSLYQEKLQMIENIGAQGDTAMKQSLLEKKAQILECWAKDVCVQNIVLIHTVEELEKQGEDKMRTLQQKIVESTNLAKKHKAVFESYEERIQSLLKDKALSNQTNESLKQDLDKIKTEYKRIRGRLNKLETDNDSLVTLITRIRDMGVWDVQGLEFQKRTFAQMFELYPNLPGSEIQTVFTREKARRIRENEDTVERLEAKVLELEHFKTRVSHNIETKDSTISELESEVTRIVEKLQQCQDECDHYKKSLIETQEQLLQTTKELQIYTKSPSKAEMTNDSESARHTEIQELLQELRNVKDQLNISVHERHSAKEETHIIRKEFSDRLRAMQESQQCLQSELTHSFDTHHLVQEKQIELNKIKDEVQMYQSKCEASEIQLNTKDKMIDELQNTIKQLNNKNIIHETDHMFQNVLSSSIPSYLKCGRDRSAKSGVFRQNNLYSSSRKPIWSDNFVKGSALDISSNAIESHNKPTSGILQSKRSTNTLKNNSFTDTETNHSTRHKQCRLATSKLSLCSCAAHSANNLSDSHYQTNYSKNITCSTMKNDRHNEVINNIDANKTEQQEVFKNQPKSDVVAQMDCNSHPKMDNPLAHNSATYNLLMGVAVKASKNILNSEIPKNVSSITVVAGHRSHHKRKDDSKDQITRCKIDVKPNSTCSPNLIEDDLSSLPFPHLSKSLEELLSELPEESCANVIHEWIQSSQSEPLKNVAGENHKLHKDHPQPSKAKKIARPLSRIASEKTALISSSKIYAEKTRQIEKDIVDIKEEWNRIFSNIDQPTAGRNIPPQMMEDDRAQFSTGAVDKIVGNDQLIQQLEMEKLQITEDFMKQLREKDVEITMQKDWCGNNVKCEDLSLWDLVNAFEDFKGDAAMQLEDLRNVNQTLSIKLTGMKDKLQLFNQLVKVKRVKEDCKPNPASSSNERRILGHFARQLKQFMSESSTSTAKIDTFERVLRNMTSFGPETKDEIRKMEWELKLLEGINKQLQSQLEVSNQEVVRLVGESNCLRREREMAEEEMLSTKVEMRSIKEASMTTDSCLNMTRNLERMKQAFECSEEIIKSKNEEIAQKDILIRSYEEYCRKSRQFLDDKSFADISYNQSQVKNEQLIKEKAQIVSEKRQLQKSVASLENRLIAFETENAQLKHSLQWYINQVERVEGLHSTWLRNLPGIAISDYGRVLQKSSNDLSTTMDAAGSGDACEEL